MREIKTVSLIGLGGIGSFLSHQILDVIGFDNLRIIADGERKERLQRDGIVVNGKPYQFQIVEPDEKTGPADLVIIITKSTGIQKAIIDIKRQVGPDTIIMAPLNGVDAEANVAKYYGYDRILYSLARVSVVMDGNEVTYNPAVAHIEYGEKINETISERVQAVKDLFDKAGIVSVIQPDMEWAIWHKFMCNVSENQTAAILDIPFGAWRVSENANLMREMVMREVIAVAAKKGIKLTEDDIRQQKRRLQRVKYENKPSTLQDLLAGRKTEVDIFAGAMVRMGKELGVPVPINEFLYYAIKVLEEKNECLI